VHQIDPSKEWRLEQLEPLQIILLWERVPVPQRVLRLEPQRQRRLERGIQSHLLQSHHHHDPLQNYHHDPQNRLFFFRSLFLKLQRLDQLLHQLLQEAHHHASSSA